MAFFIIEIIELFWSVATIVSVPLALLMRTPSITCPARAVIGPDEAKFAIRGPAGVLVPLLGLTGAVAGVGDGAGAGTGAGAGAGEGGAAGVGAPVGAGAGDATGAAAITVTGVVVVLPLYEQRFS